MIGVFICHCGNNIAATVDIDILIEKLSRNYDIKVYNETFLCSNFGINLINEKIKDDRLNRVVIAACSPKHHEGIFMKGIRKLNPYLLEIVNIREQCSWVHEDSKDATLKALSLINGGVQKSKHLQEIKKIDIPIKKDVLIIGAGISGIQCALDLSDNGYKVYLVEKNPSIGGNMVKLNKTFPTNDCSMCTIAPKISDVSMRENIEIITSSEVNEIKGHLGNYSIKIQKNPRFVDEEKCTGCGSCAKVCLMAEKIPNKFDMGLGKRGAIYIPFLQAVPLVYTVDKKNCIYLTKGKCGKSPACVDACEAKAIDFNQKPEEIELTVGAIVIATGYEQYNVFDTEYNYEHPDVITGLELERMLSATGPTNGELLRPSDLKMPQSVLFVQCVGSRDRRHKEYCSKICCMYATKNALLIKEHWPETKVYVCYSELRASGRGYEEYYDRARKMGVRYIRGNVANVDTDEKDNLIVNMEDISSNEPIEINADLVVLSVALAPNRSIEEIKSIKNLETGSDGFLSPLHPKIQPVETKDPGVFICGAITGPKPIQECITDASACVSHITSYLREDEITFHLKSALLNPDICIKCGKCLAGCNYDAIDTKGEFYEVVDISCLNCGKCTVICPTNAIDLRYYSDSQIEAQIKGILASDGDSIIAFCCNECSYAAADLAGLSRYAYSPKIKVIRVPCTGRVSSQHIISSFDLGAKGVIVAGCLEGQCHYTDGNINAAKNVEIAKKTLNLIGIGSSRLEMFFMSSAMADKFVDAARDLEERCR